MHGYLSSIGIQMILGFVKVIFQEQKKNLPALYKVCLKHFYKLDFHSFFFLESTISSSFGHVLASKAQQLSSRTGQVSSLMLSQK